MVQKRRIGSKSSDQRMSRLNRTRWTTFSVPSCRDLHPWLRDMSWTVVSPKWIRRRNALPFRAMQAGRIYRRQEVENALVRKAMSKGEESIRFIRIEKNRSDDCPRKWIEWSVRAIGARFKQLIPPGSPPRMDGRQAHQIKETLD
jgi:hypothetical protein